MKPNAATRTSQVPKFLHTLYTILSTEHASIIAWSPCGTFFQIFDMNRLEEIVLPRYFKHNKFVSFQRQLNNFGFHKWTKTRASVCTFSHDTLVQCHPSELSKMLQRTHSTVTETAACRKRHREESEPVASEKKWKLQIDVSSDWCEFTDSADLWTVDWSAFNCDNQSEDDDEDTVGMPIELLFPDETCDVEPLLTDESCIIDESEWRMLVKCLA